MGAEIDVNGMLDKVERLAFQAGLNQGLAQAGAQARQEPKKDPEPKPVLYMDKADVESLLVKVEAVLSSYESSDDVCGVLFAGDKTVSKGDFKALKRVLVNVIQRWTEPRG